ncbi:MAG: riboflavin kinase [Caldisericia bacterium]
MKSLQKIERKTYYRQAGFRFGRNGSGNPEVLNQILSKTNIPVTIMESHIFGDRPISSTRIRDCLLNSGDLKSVNYMLGRNYCLAGVVVCGAGVGKTLGYPTANIFISSKHKLIPANGVYGCIAKVRGKKYIAAVSIGNRPTFDDDHRSIEAHLLDYDQDCYNEEIEVEFVTMVRGQIRFENKDELISQIAADTKR